MDEKLFLVSDVKSNNLLIINMQLTTHPIENDWQTHTISFKEETKEWLISRDYLSQLSLEFIVDKNSDPIEIKQIFSGSPKNGIALTIAAFDQFLYGFGSIFITIAVVLFAFSTMITWSYYGEVALKFYLAQKQYYPSKWVFISVILLGSTIKLSTVLNFSDLMIGLMVIPNVIAILLLVEDVYDDKVTYFKLLKEKAFKQYK